MLISAVDTFMTTFSIMRAFAPSCLTFLAWAALSSSLWASDDSALSNLPFEQLLQREVVPASTLARQISQSPSAVAIVTADDIRAYGYRTLADVINSMRGLYTTYDRRYQYMGGRGFGVPGDYAGRIMVLIDGYPTQDSLFNQAYIDESGLLDLELVERVEYVPGTGSVTYGNNAMLGIINIVTRRGSDVGSTQLATEFASHGGRKQRVTVGRRFDNGADLLLSASVLASAGQDLYFPAYDTPANNRGIAQDQDSERNKRIFGKFSFEGWTIEGAYAQRRKAVPVPMRELMSFNQPFINEDENAFLNARYETDLGLSLSTSSSLYFGHYAYSDQRAFTDGDIGNREHSARWWGLDQKFVGHWFERHAVLLGFEFKDDARQLFETRYQLPVGGVSPKHTQSFERRTASVYLTDEFRVNEDWSLNIGVRYDDANDLSGNWSPRLAAIFRQSPMTVWKASYSEAFRMPNANERWRDGNQARPEYVEATELTLRHEYSPNGRLTASLYRYQQKDVYVSEMAWGSARTHGAELEYEHNWHNGTRLRSSAAWQKARDTAGQDLANSPDWLGKLNLTALLPGLPAVRGGLEVQYVGPRLTLERRPLGSYTLTNLTFSGERKWHGLSAVFSIRNLFGRDYDAVSPFTWDPGTGKDVLRMDGRTYWLQLSLDL